MQFKALTFLTLAAVTAAVALPASGANAGNIAVKGFTDDCKSQSLTVICCNKAGSDASTGDLTGNLNGADVTCNKVPDYVAAGTLAQVQAQCGCGLGCCTSDAIQLSREEPSAPVLGVLVSLSRLVSWLTAALEMYGGGMGDERG
ncbi:unnamed protein product [Tuber aestivum]|uniref:Hydrophobin n=1 Tax=Tuber aestivum TaxID=59557 RepID=A0A292Q5Z9_9PEZI|nr:unnamed protein product [Tuber aestivum]